MSRTPVYADGTAGRLWLGLAALGALVLIAGTAAGEEGEAKGAAAAAKADAEPQVPELAQPLVEQSIEQIAETARRSVVTVTFSGRNGSQQGLGSGFVVGKDGLIATNLHVIGEARPIQVEFADGKKYDVQSVHATDRHADLAILKIDADDLPTLELGDSDQLRDGQAVVAVGNPLGLERSIVSGIVSGRREIEGRSMIQLAIPIEPGNSGGPLLDRYGRVHGLLTIKSLVTNNLGFAVTSNSLKPLLEKPNSVPMSRWLTIGTLDSTDWSTPTGGRWRQQSGRIQASETAAGFAGRALCLSKRETLDMPYEVAVRVRLDNESGAAGLVIASDGQHRHYGFYPSGGKLRLTRFDGPDVYSWKVLSDQASAAYRPGDWNTLKVRVEAERLVCYVNDELHLEVADDTYRQGQTGLAKFRDTVAEFRGFRLAKEIASAKLDAEVAAALAKAVAELPLEGKSNEELIGKFLPEAQASSALLTQRAKLLERQAAEMHRLAQIVRQRHVQAELVTVLDKPEDEIELFRACLLIAKLDNADVDVEESLEQLDRLTRELKAGLADDASDGQKIDRLNKYLFEEQGFHGSRVEYYNRSNSYLNEVLDDREGLPITLSVLYLELAERVGLKMSGVGLPGHFVVQHHPAEGDAQLIDVYEQGKAMSRAEANQLFRAYAGRDLAEEDLTPASKKSIVIRMLGNLRGIATDKKDSDAMLKYVDVALAVSPDSIENRSMRVLLRSQSGDTEGAIADLDWLIENSPDNVDLERVREFRRRLEEQQQ